MYNILSIILLIFAGYLMVSGFAYFFQNRLIYFPDPLIQATPQEIGLEYEEITFSTADGVRLHGWFVPGPGGQDRPLALFCHGNAGNISHRLDQIRIIHDLGLACFLFDYRGYGQSQGRPSEKGTYLDAEAAWSLLVAARGVSPQDIVCWGRSLGASIAARLARDHAPRALIVESGFTSLLDMARKLYPFLPVGLLAVYDYPTKQYLRERTCPLLIVHSRDDEVVPYSFGRTLFEKARPPKEFLELSGGHNDGFLVSGDYYTDGVGSFLKRCGQRKEQP